MLENPTKYADAWNFGPQLEDNLIVEKVVQNAVNYWGYGNYEIPVLTEQPHEAGLLKLDISKTINQLSWKPKYSAAQAIEKTIAWYKNFPTNSKDFTLQQIKEYIA